MTHGEWCAEAVRHFGPDPMQWRFVCPVCKHVASVQDYEDAGAPDNAAAFSCIGRWAGAKRDALGLNPEAIAYGRLPPADGPGPCNYAGGGLFRLNPVEVVFPDGEKAWAFDFAPATQQETES